MIRLKDIEQAKRRIEKVAHKTPLEYSKYFSRLCQNDVYLKLENLQLTGSFKIRGAYNKISTLPKNSKVIAASAGNHAQGVAFSATKLGIKSYIVMPENAPITKVVSTRNYGAEVILYGATFDDAMKKAKELKKRKSLTFVHPFDDEKVIAGQGTIALEIIEQLPDVDAIIVPIGGGGLISGIAIAAKSINPKIKIYGVQASGCPSMYESIKEGHLVESKTAKTIADGIAVKHPSKLTFNIVKKYVDKIALVDDEEITATILDLLERTKLVVEPAGAVGLAALVHKKFKIKNKKVVIVISGGNIDITRLSTIIGRGLFKSGREIRFKTLLEDKPGELFKLLKVIAENKGNIIFINHDRLKSPIGVAEVEIGLETVGKEHIKKIIKALKENRYKIEIV